MPLSRDTLLLTLLANLHPAFILSNILPQVTLGMDKNFLEYRKWRAKCHVSIHLLTIYFVFPVSEIKMPGSIYPW